MNELINDALSCIKREYKMMDKMLTYEENADSCNFIALQQYYKILKDKTDSIIDELVGKYGVKNVVGEILSQERYDIDDIEINKKNFYLNNLFEIINLNKSNNVFSEESNKYLYLMYLWNYENLDINGPAKSILHRMMRTNLFTSNFIRNYYSGDIEKAQNVSDPDSKYGSIIANDMANRLYFDKLNDLTWATFFHESKKPSSAVDSDEVNFSLAFRTILELRLATLCTQMQKRDIFYSKINSPINDNVKRIMKYASQLSDDFNNKEKHKCYEKVIYL